MDRARAHARPGQRGLWIRELVSEHRSQIAAGCARQRGDVSRQRAEHRVRRLGERPRGGRALDSQRRRAQGIRRARAGCAARSRKVNYSECAAVATMARGGVAETFFSFASGFGATNAAITPARITKAAYLKRE